MYMFRFELKTLQLLPDELDESTYGLEVKNAKNGKYQAEDFFIFLDILGSGRTGVVFRAIFKPDNKELAVKFISHFRKYRANVMRELSVLKMTRKCRFLVQYHSHFRVGNNLYIVTELYEGGSLQALLDPLLALPPLLTRVFMKEVCTALFFLHHYRLVHRDLNPSNIVITTTGHLRVADFSLTRMIEEPMGEILTNCGHPAYKAPELYLDRPCTCGIDWWSVGILLYRFVTGVCPFETDKLTRGFQSVTKLNVKYPSWAFDDPGTLDLCQRLLVKEPRHRLGSGNKDVIKKLWQILSPSDTMGKGSARSKRLRSTSLMPHVFSKYLFGDPTGSFVQ
ncbi:calcium-dependent protein kinase C-like [Aplysia californica]|uniref:Calcium-dependent protein kinase C-like n=1 Tax=Aplysia californica TaxID=6500 RepID=A0ABM0ZXP5_APLCA|nr:calcium-dependent protein kinase C-like [Aplysia californica]